MDPSAVMPTLRSHSRSSRGRPRVPPGELQPRPISPLPALATQHPLRVQAAWREGRRTDLEVVLSLGILRDGDGQSVGDDNQAAVRVDLRHLRRRRRRERGWTGQERQSALVPGKRCLFDGPTSGHVVRGWARGVFCERGRLGWAQARRRELGSGARFSEASQEGSARHLLLSGGTTSLSFPATAGKRENDSSLTR